MSPPPDSRPQPGAVADRLLPRLGPLGAVLGGGLLGSAFRAVLVFYLPVAPGSFPVATLSVNLVGALLLGLYLARWERAASARWSLQFWAVGVLGSLTTFSALSIEVVHLLEVDETWVALGYVAASVIGGVLLALAGQRVGSAVR
jgi:fluoride exporter